MFHVKLRAAQHCPLIFKVETKLIYFLFLFLPKSINANFAEQEFEVNHFHTEAHNASCVLSSGMVIPFFVHSKVALFIGISPSDTHSSHLRDTQLLNAVWQ